MTLGGNVHGSRRFTIDDQRWFATVSGDANPIHLDRIYARRTIAGDVVVHGVHAVMWALDSYLSAIAGATPTSLRGINVTFRKPIFLNETIEIAWTGTGVESGLRIQSGETLLVWIGLTPPSNVPPQLDEPRDSSPWSAVPRPLDRGALRTASGRHPSLETTGELVRAFPALARVLGATTLSSLAALSRIVGMECPGMQSLFAGLSLAFSDDAAISDSIAYRVTRSEPAMAPVQISVDAPALRGVVTAFHRPAPVEQASFAQILPRVVANEFDGARALIIGGSRGLGELTAKIVAAGGGETIITYSAGQDDAARVAAEIASNGAKAGIAQLDVLRPFDALEDIRRRFGAPTSLYYFATPRITGRRAASFEALKLREFERYYVEAFFDVCQSISAQSTGRVTMFYPSTVFIDEHSADNIEYAMAKASGELLCSHLHESASNLRVVTSRLPRMLTDQTAGVIQHRVADPVDTMLAVIREVQAISTAT